MSSRRHPDVWILVIGFVFHLVFIGSVFDCYFTSPIVQGMPRHRLEHAEAKRLVLIVADGLRADLVLTPNAFPSISNTSEVVAPHLRSIMETRGAFGISHTRVPTESRPGHSALIGGVYEDVSTVTKGWSMNLAEFDTVFNQSSHTFAFGSPDTILMFVEGATPGKMDAWCYDQKEEDYTKDARGLDLWVLDNLRALFINSTQDAELDAMLRRDKTVFFLHLLGIDTTGHSYRPHSREYMENIRLVDQIVRQTEELFAQLYQDEETAFIFTADHGMSDIGTHGDGDPVNTRTPLIVWGKGVRGPVLDSIPSSHDDYSEPWKLSGLLRRDVEQADIAVLMAALIGIDWPINSLGVLADVDPSRPGYLLSAEGEIAQAKAALVNAKVVMDHYLVKHEQRKAHTSFYRQFHAFPHRSSADTPWGEDIVDIEDLISKGKYTEARSRSATVIKSALDGIHYLDTYDRALIRFIAIGAYMGWIAFSAAAILIEDQTEAATRISRPLGENVFALLILAGCWIFFTLQRSPWMFHVYVCFPIYFWSHFVHRAGSVFLKYLIHDHVSRLAVLRLLRQGSLVIGALLGMTLGYTYRKVWSVGFVVIGVLWSAVSWRSGFCDRHFGLLLSWSIACLVTAVFPCLSLDKRENLLLITCGGLCMLTVGAVGGLRLPVVKSESRPFRLAVAFQCLMIAASMIVTVSSAVELRAKTGLPSLNQALGWCIFVIASIFSLAFMIRLSNPLATIWILFLTFSTCFVLLSISTEGLFYFAFSITLFIWIQVEVVSRESFKSLASQDSTSYRPRLDDVRTAIFFLFFMQVAYFSTARSAAFLSGANIWRREWH